MKWRSRARHSTIVNNHRLYSWGGKQEDLPMVRDNDKRKFTSSVDILHLPTLKWERRSTTATPPAGVMNYACTNIRDSILYFGGKCKPSDCYHNDLFELNTLTDEWSEIINSSPDNEPMRKSGCGMISFNMNGEYNLLVIGGFGPTPITTHTASKYILSPSSQKHCYTNTHTGSKYILSPNSPNHCYTDEIHTMCVNSSPGIT